MTSFPYIHLSDSELLELYRISGFNLGASDKDQLDNVKKLRALSHDRFQSSFADILSTKSSVPPTNSIDLSPLLWDSPVAQSILNG